jgi:hypothetical protein
MPAGALAVIRRKPFIPGRLRRGWKPERRASVRWEVVIDLTPAFGHPLMERAMNRAREVNRVVPDNDPSALGSKLLRFIVHDGLVWSDHAKTYLRPRHELYRPSPRQHFRRGRRRR